MQTAPLVFVTWSGPGLTRPANFRLEAVNILYAMLTRNYQAPFRLVCLTDDPTGIDGAVDIVPLPVTKADHLMVPSCYKGFP